MAARASSHGWSVATCTWPTFPPGTTASSVGCSIPSTSLRWCRREASSAGHRTLDIGSLAGQQLLVLRRGFGSRDWFDAACEAANIRPSVLLESNSHNAILGLAGAGYGIGILPSATTIPKKGIRAIPLLHRRVSIGKWTMLARDPRRFVPPYVERFADELVAHAQDPFPGEEVVRRAPAIRRPKVPEA